MKKIIKGLVLVGIILISTTGCFKRDNLEDAIIYTSVYPTEYITNKLYGKHSTIKSIYPDGVKISDYKLTEKQLKDYSSSDIYIFNGLSNEKEYVTKLFNYNKHIKIIDTSMSMEYANDINELWLSPSNFLMLTQNIKNGLLEYINNHYLQTEIKNNYEELKIKISNLDAKLGLLSESSDNAIIVADNKMFKYLEKYGITVICLEDGDKAFNDAAYLINNGIIDYIFIKDTDSASKSAEKLINTYGIEIKKFNTLETLSNNERSNKEDYLSLMQENIELLKDEIYN